MTNGCFNNHSNRYFNPFISRLMPLTPDHIAYGVPGAASGCPVALAMSDAGYQEVTVGLDGVSASRQDFTIGPRLSAWIDAYEHACVENGPAALRPETLPEGPISLLADAAQQTVELCLEELCPAPDGT